MNNFKIGQFIKSIFVAFAGLILGSALGVGFAMIVMSIAFEFDLEYFGPKKPGFALLFVSSIAIGSGFGVYLFQILFQSPKKRITNG